MEYKQRASGLLVPAHPTIRNLKAPEEFKPDWRKKAPEVGQRITPPSPDDLRYLKEHIHGRAEAAAQVAASLAYLKSRGFLREIDTITATGAVYQDKKGTKLYPRAHRFPCNIMVGYGNVPDLVWMQSLALGQALKVPFAITDPLPVMANYVDRLFESSGSVETVLYAARFIAHEQPKGKPVHVNMVRHAVEMILLPGFLEAYEAARQTLREKGEPGLASLAQSGPTSKLTDERLAELEEALAAMEGNPSENLDIVDLFLAAEAEEADNYQPLMGGKDQIIAQEALLDLVDGKGTGTEA